MAPTTRSPWVNGMPPPKMTMPPEVCSSP
jgi:hypothetical protein